MFLDSIEAHNFRNVGGKLTWGRRLNIIHGNNGQGKTNWLEAIYLLSRTKSFRTQRLRESIRFGHDSAVLRGQVTRGGIVRNLQLTLEGNLKSLSINGKREPLSRYFGQLQVFAFTADELEVVRGLPEARRRFIDRGVCSLRPAYIQTLADYNRVLKQKNRILQDAAEQDMKLDSLEDLLSPWNEQIVALATQIHVARTGYIEELNGVLERSLFDKAELQIRYHSALDGKGNLAEYQSLLTDWLQLRLQAELAAGRALLGPHRDDLEILLGGREMRVFGSAGQQRSTLLLLDLAAISLYNVQHGDYPLFLIDDVDAELDEKRIRHLLEYLEGRTQTFITTSKRGHVEGFLSQASVYEIEEGEVVTGEADRGQRAAFSTSPEGR
jgi:DNA replication and repair protein RecF